MAFLPNSRLLRRLGLGLVLLVCLAIGPFWLYSANRLAAYMDQKTFGDASVADFCASSDIGGFPFRLRVKCGGFSAPLSIGQNDVLAKVEQARGEASIFSPGHLSMSLSSPVSLQKPDGSVFAKLRHDGLTLDVAWSRAKLDKANLDVAALDWRPESNDAGVAFNLQKLSAQLQPLREEGALRFDLAGEGLTSPLLQALIQKSDLGHFALKAKISPAPAPAADWRAALDLWRQNAGAVAIEQFDWQAGELALRIDGTLALDEAHRPSGRLTLAAKGAGPLLTRLGVPAFAAQAQNIIGALLGKPAAQPEDRDAIVLPLVLAKGQVFLGPLRLPASLAPLY
ncbi:DUF2125 domain-containing protein [uncultured Rhodoblastus sp.]|uniref:DUF2125 domain-containing protein n=1 Tax=uncultured Rhodoblastus sp. TaxID=543037 RepID=UPI002600DDAC|nr:DUF2125 domain-containing protein [uncultured Rhodoblastus sp.]